MLDIGLVAYCGLMCLNACLKSRVLCENMCCNHVCDVKICAYLRLDPAVVPRLLRLFCALESSSGLSSPEIERNALNT